MAISSLGAGTSIDMEGLLSKLMAAESAPLTTLAKKEAAYQAKLSAYGSLSGAVSSFQTAMANLSKASSFQALKTSIGDKDIFSATAASNAISGNYQVNVTQLAQAQTLSSAGQTSKTASIGSGATTTISFQFGKITGGTLSNGAYTGAAFAQDANQATGTITIDSTNNSLQGMRDAINAANMGVTATLVSDGSDTPDRLVFTSNKTGETSSMKITVDGDAAIQNLMEYDPAGVQNLKQNSAAQNTKLDVNGIAISSATNTVKEAIQGVTLDVAKIGSTSLNITQDTTSVETSINAFIKSYNELNTTIKNLTAYTPSAVKGEAGTGGPLVGDSTVRTLQENVRKTLTGSLEGLSNSSMSLSKIGVAFQKDGSLALDSAKLKKAMTDNFNDIGALFATVGKATDSLVNFNSSTTATKAGSYPITVTKLATQATLKGDANLNAGNTVIAANSSLSVTLDGISAKILLTEGSYTASQLAVMLQSAINGAPALTSASSKVSAKIDADGFLNLTSDRWGSASNLTINSGTNISVASLFGSTTTGTVGEDVAGTIDGATATGSGQMLSAPKGSDAEGLKLEIVGGAIGDRGRIDFSQGYADRLNKLAGTFIGSSGLIASRTSGINNSIKSLHDASDALQVRLTAIEKQYRTQFTALSVSIASMTSTSEYLTQQLAQIASLSTQ